MGEHRGAVERDDGMKSWVGREYEQRQEGGGCCYCFRLSP